MSKEDLLKAYKRTELFELARSVGHRGHQNLKKESMVDLYLLKRAPSAPAPAPAPAPPAPSVLSAQAEEFVPQGLDSQSTDSSISFQSLDSPIPHKVAWRYYDDVAKIVLKRVKSCTSEWHLLRLIYTLDPSRVRIVRLSHHNEADQLDHFTLNVNTSTTPTNQGGVSYHIYFTKDQSDKLWYQYATVLRGTDAVEICAEF